MMDHRPTWKTLLVGLLLVLPTTVASQSGDTGDRAFKAEYRAYYGAMRGASTQFSLEPGRNGKWLWRSRSEPAGMVAMFRDDVVTEHSRFRINDGAIVPTSYRYHHETGGDTRRQRRLDFDWDESIVRYDDNGNRGELALETGELDRFLAQYALMRDMRKGNRPDSYTIVYRDERFRQDLIYLGEERIRVRAGRFDTVKIAMEDADSDRMLMMWMSPELGYLPVQLEQREPGETTVRMELESTNRERE